LTDKHQSYLVLVELVIDQLILALFLERDNDESDEDVDEEEREDDEIDDIEDRHVHTEARLRSAVLVRGINWMLQNSVSQSTTASQRHRQLTAFIFATEVFLAHTTNKIIIIIIIFDTIPIQSYDSLLRN